MIGNPPLKRKEKLVAVGLDLFAEHGFSRTTIKDIARMAGGNSALIYYYFRDKAALLRAAIAQAISLTHEQYIGLASKHRGPMGQIDAWLDANALSVNQIRKLVKVMLDYSSEGQGDAEINDAIQKFYELERMILVEGIRQGIHDGVFRPTDPERLASRVSVYLDGVMVASLIRKNFNLEGAWADLKRVLNEHLRPDDGGARPTTADQNFSLETSNTF